MHSSVPRHPIMRQIDRSERVGQVYPMSGDEHSQLEELSVKVEGENIERGDEREHSRKTIGGVDADNRRRDNWHPSKVLHLFANTEHIPRGRISRHMSNRTTLWLIV